MDIEHTMILIPARGGSKGIPRKNLADLCGKPLVWWTIEQAKAADVGPVVVSTDDADIRALAWDGGVLVRNRPAECATDEASTESVMVDLLQESKLHTRGNMFHPDLPQYLIVLQPTSPLRLASHIRSALAYMQRQQADSVFSSTFTHLCVWRGGPSRMTPLWQGAEERRRKRRQECEPEIAENGCIYIVKVDTFLKEGTRFCGKTVPHIMDNWTRFEVDRPEDLGLVRMILRHRLERGCDGITT